MTGRAKPGPYSFIEWPSRQKPNRDYQGNQRQIFCNVQLVMKRLKRAPRDDLLIKEDERRQRERGCEQKRSVLPLDATAPRRDHERGADNQSKLDGRAREVRRMRKSEKLHAVHRRRAVGEQGEVRQQSRSHQGKDDCKNFESQLVTTWARDEEDERERRRPRGGGGPQVKVREDQKGEDKACRNRILKDAATCLARKSAPDESAEDEEEGKGQSRNVTTQEGKILESVGRLRPEQTTHRGIDNRECSQTEHDERARRRYSFITRHQPEQPEERERRNESDQSGEKDERGRG